MSWRGSAGRRSTTTPDPPLGEIFVIAVDPEVQAHGLGRFLAIAGLDWLTEQGLTEAMLYVESDNGSARALVRRARLHDHHDQALVDDRDRASHTTSTEPKLAEHLADQPRYRVDQVWRGLYERATPIEELTELPKALRAGSGRRTARVARAGHRVGERRR